MKKNINGTVALFESVLEALPYRLSDEIRRICKADGFIPEEIRIRAERHASLTYCGRNILLMSALSSEECSVLLKHFSKGSMYAYKDSIAAGYIPLGNGIRVGVSGSALTENGRVTAVYGITSIVVRLPKECTLSAEPLYRHLTRGDRIRSALIFSPSGVGKTTILRSLAYLFSRQPESKRVAVIDTREEIGAFLGGSGLTVDILCGYPKEAGIEIAARTLNAELIISDEIFGEAEARALAGAVNCGIPVICSAHAGNICELISRPGIELLHKLSVFDEYVGIMRDEGYMNFLFDCVVREEYADI